MRNRKSNLANEGLPDDYQPMSRTTSCLLRLFHGKSILRISEASVRPKDLVAGQCGLDEDVLQAGWGGRGPVSM